MNTRNLADKFNKLGIHYASRGSYIKAMAAYKKSLEVRPNYPEVILNLAAAMLGSQNYDQAIKHLNKILLMNPSDRTAIDYLTIARECLTNKQYPPRLKKGRHFQIIAFDSMADQELDEAMRNMEYAVCKISKFLRKELKKTIFVEIHPKYFPVPMIWFSNRPIQPKITVDPFNVKGALVVHEITHAISFNYNRFFAEGLAMYMQYKFSKERLWPFPDLELEECIVKYSDALIPLNELVLETSSSLDFFNLKKINTFTNRLSYVQSGSFIKFLIEEYALEKFNLIYKNFNDPSLISSDYHKKIKKVYEKELQELEDIWLSKVGVRNAGS